MRGTNNLRQQPDITTSVPGDFETAELMKLFNNKRKYSRGYRLPIAVGSQTFENMQFPGMARLMLGFTLFDTTGDANNLITININQEDIVSNVSWSEYTKTNVVRAVPGEVTGSSYNGEYYIYPRPLSGNDAIKITYTALTGNGFLIPVFRFVTILPNS